MSRIVADIIFHLQSQRRGRCCLQFECDFMFLCTFMEQYITKAAWAALFGGAGAHFMIWKGNSEIIPESSMWFGHVLQQ